MPLRDISRAVINSLTPERQATILLKKLKTTARFVRKSDRLDVILGGDIKGNPKAQKSETKFRKISVPSIRAAVKQAFRHPAMRDRYSYREIIEGIKQIYPKEVSAKLPFPSVSQIINESSVKFDKLTNSQIVQALAQTEELDPSSIQLKHNLTNSSLSLIPGKKVANYKFKVGDLTASRTWDDISAHISKLESLKENLKSIGMSKDEIKSFIGKIPLTVNIAATLNASRGRLHRRVSKITGIAQRSIDNTKLTDILTRVNNQIDTIQSRTQGSTGAT